MSTPVTPPTTLGDQGAASSVSNPTAATDQSLAGQSGFSNTTVRRAVNRDYIQFLPDLAAPPDYSGDDEDYEEFDDESEDQDDQDGGSEDNDDGSEIPDQGPEEHEEFDEEVIITTPPSGPSIRAMHSTGTSASPAISRMARMFHLSGTVTSTSPRTPAPMALDLSIPRIRLPPSIPRVNLPPVSFPTSATTAGRLDLIVANAQLNHLTRRLSHNSQPVPGQSNHSLPPPASRNPAPTTRHVSNPALHPPGYPLPDSRRSASAAIPSPSLSIYRERYDSFRRNAEADIRAGRPIPSLDSVAGQQRRRAAGARVRAVHDQRRNASLESPMRPTPLEIEALTLESECKICFSQIADTLLLPCCHLVLCQWCADQIGAQQEGGGGVAGTCCPVCRVRVEDRLLVYRG